jgi:hypothetical protein
MIEEGRRIRHEFDVTEEIDMVYFGLVSSCF